MRKRTKEVQVITPRSETDRRMVGRLHVRMFEESFACLDYLVRVREDAEEETGHRIQATKLILERVAPALQRIDATAATMFLPMAAGEGGSVVTSEDQQRAEAVALLRGILAKLTAGDGGPVKPGLVLLREGHARAG